ncbi:hypothetical protein Ga0061067_10862 [Pannonibacter indicus]|uniref:Uncharacterized protein n=1 Tax=Pannonibacter indicus TaxID=466044 RepID=A0A0K6I3J1_9HYPH|nr:hypothetical protein Ga0061067_10862 [Pannonibacter indicus]
MPPARCVSPAASGCPFLDDAADLDDLQSARVNLLPRVLEITDLDGLGQPIAEKARTRIETGWQFVLTGHIRAHVDHMPAGTTRAGIEQRFTRRGGRDGDIGGGGPAGVDLAALKHGGQTSGPRVEQHDGRIVPRQADGRGSVGGLCQGADCIFARMAAANCAD